jgi:hypothetical protein
MLPWLLGVFGMGPRVSYGDEIVDAEPVVKLNVVGNTSGVDHLSFLHLKAGSKH